MDKGLVFEKGMNGAGDALVALVEHFVRRRFTPEGPDHLGQEAVPQFGRLLLRRLAPWNSQ